MKEKYKWKDREKRFLEINARKLIIDSYGKRLREIALSKDPFSDMKMFNLRESVMTDLICLGSSPSGALNGNSGTTIPEINTIKSKE